MNSFYQSFDRLSWSCWLKDIYRISPRVQNHLKRVYLTLWCALGAYAVGAYLQILMNIRGILTFYGALAGVVWFYRTPPYQESKRFGILMGIAMLEGASGGPLINLLHAGDDPSILVTAFVGTAIVFGCFTAAAIVAKRMEYLYLGGMLSSGISILMWFRFASIIFGQSAGMFDVEPYFWLLFCLVVVVLHTQVIIERTRHGDVDYMKHALNLFIVFFTGIVRIIVIFMLKNASDKEEKEKKRI